MCHLRRKQRLLPSEKRLIASGHGLERQVSSRCDCESTWQVWSKVMLRTSGRIAAAILVVMAAGPEVASKPGPIDWTAVDHQGAVVGGRLQGVVTAAGSGVPLEGVRVTVTSTTASHRPAVAVTDSSGHYVVSQLPPGRYTVMFSKAGFVSVYHGQAHSVTADRSVPLVIDLRGGQHLDRISAPLTRAGAIEGRILDGRGEPVVDVTVSASRLDMAGSERRLVAVSRKVMSDDRGFYRLFGLGRVPRTTRSARRTPHTARDICNL